MKWKVPKHEGYSRPAKIGSWKKIPHSNIRRLGKKFDLFMCHLAALIEAPPVPLDLEKLVETSRMQFIAFNITTKTISSGVRITVPPTL